MNTEAKPPSPQPTTQPADDAVKPQHATEPQVVPPESTDESMTGEEDPGASLDSVVNPVPPPKRPS